MIPAHQVEHILRTHKILGLKEHQIQAVVKFFDCFGRQAYFHDTGTGKTRTCIASYKCLRELNNDPKLKMLVLCPINLINDAWIEELNKLKKEGHCNYNWLNMNTGERSNHPLDDTDIYLVNFEYLRGENKFKALMELLAKHEWICVIDESSKIKNWESLNTGRINGQFVLDPANTGKRKRYIWQPGIKSLCKYRICGSGTPAPNIEWEYWAQMYWLDENILGDDFYKFRNQNFQLARGKQVAMGTFMNKAQLREAQRTGFKYEMLPGARDAMFERMKPFCHIVESLEGMPEEIDQITSVEMSLEQKKIYNQMKNEYIAEIKREIDGKETTSFAIANIALTKFMRLRQITSGFVTDDQDQAIGFLKTNPKIEALRERIEMYGKHQTIIWFQFRWEVAEITKLLEEIGGGISYMYGGVDKKDRRDESNDFKSGKNRFMVAHPRSMAHGFNLTNARYQDFFSMDYSSEDYTQCRGRTARMTQQFTCVYNHIVCKGTIDEDVLAIVQGKITAQEVGIKFLKEA